MVDGILVSVRIYLIVIYFYILYKFPVLRRKKVEDLDKGVNKWVIIQS